MLLPSGAYTVAPRVACSSWVSLLPSLPVSRRRRAVKTKAAPRYYSGSAGRVRLRRPCISILTRALYPPGFMLRHSAAVSRTGGENRRGTQLTCVTIDAMSPRRSGVSAARRSVITCLAKPNQERSCCECIPSKRGLWCWCLHTHRQQLAQLVAHGRRSRAERVRVGLRLTRACVGKKDNSGSYINHEKAHMNHELRPIRRY